MRRCDFCGVPLVGPFRIYFSEPGLFFSRDGVRVLDDGNWATCAQCIPAVEAGDRAEAARRGALLYGADAERVIKIQSLYFEHATGHYQEVNR